MSIENYLTIDRQDNRINDVSIKDYSTIKETKKQYIIIEHDTFMTLCSISFLNFNDQKNC